MGIVRKRTACKGWATRSANSLKDYLQRDDITKVKLGELISDFDKRLEALDCVQTQVEMSFEDLDALLADIEVSGNYRDSICETRLKPLECFEKLSVTNPLEADVTSVTSTGTADVKLPKLSLPKFSGDVLQWQSFWDQFTAVVDSSDIPDISKFSYLRSLLEGEAKQSIQGLSLTSQHYQSARQILTDRFGRKERIIFTHIQTLLNMPVMNKCSVSNLWKLNDDLQSHTRSLEALGICGTQYGVILTPLILSRLPQDVRLEWSREGEGHESDLSYLLKFLEKEILRRERSQVFKDTVQVSSSVPEARRFKAPPTAAALQTASMNVKPSAPHECGVCGKNHPTDRCFKLLHCNGSERRERVQRASLCYRCLRKGHIAKGCSSVCSKCNGRHYKLLCGVQSLSVGSSPNGKGINKHVSMASAEISGTVESLSSVKPSASNATETTSKVILVGSSARVLLQTARVKVRGARGVTEATILFDTGSDRSYVTSELVGKVGPLWVDSQPIAYSGFGAGNTSKAQMRSIFDLILQDEHGSDQSLFATEVPVICAPLVCPEVPQSVLTSFGELSMAWDYTLSSEIKVDILVGLDFYWKFVKPQITGCSVEGLMAQSTVFGWVLFGSVPVSQMTAPVMSHPMLCLTVSEQSVKSFWELESIGISPDKEDSVLTRFENDLRQVEGRYEVTLPWKSGARERLLDNEKLAKYRLDSLRRRLERDPPLKLRYDAAIQEMCDTSIVEEVPVDEMACENPVFYMPHRPVVRETAVSTKVRPVFDASAKGYNGISLNDCMEIGPCLLTNLTQILIRFRRWKFALTADIQKAFLQIAVHRDDCDVHRFLWDCDGQVKVMRFRRVPFGNCSSPFLLNATVQHHLSLFPASRTVTELQQNLYVDDFLSGCDFVEETCQMIHEACDVMSQGCMTLTKWSSNSTEVADVLQREFKGKHLDDDSIKVLGLYWLASSDCFMFHAAVPPEGLCLTKRVVLSWFSRLFDPLGLAAPYIMQAKCLFQELWKLGLQWDDEIPHEFQIQFMRWVDGLKALGQWRIPRNYTGTRWCDIKCLQLYGFGDASPKGYGACVYLRAEMTDGSYVSSLVIAKSKVAPLKQMTLPRLELLGALLCARLVRFVKEALMLSGEVQDRCWTDSMIVLSWIRSDPVRWKTFVSNRVSEIQTLVSVDRWSHCPGSENPADLLTRGVCAEELVNSKLWLEGPQFLLQDPDVSEVCDELGDLDPVLTSESAGSALVTSHEVRERIFDVDRWGSLTKAIRVVAWVLRYISNLKLTRVERQLTSDLTFEELKCARYHLILSVQQHEFAVEISALKEGRTIPKTSALARLTPFLGEDGLLRIQGRLQFSALSHAEKHPIILPRCHLSVLLTRFQHRLLKHAGSDDPVRAETISAPSTPLKTVDDNQNRDATPSACATKPYVTSRGRVVKPVVRLDIWESNMCNLLVMMG